MEPRPIENLQCNLDLNSGEAERDEEIENSSSYVDPGVEFASLTIEEMEDKLKFGQPMQNEMVAYGLYCIYAKSKGFSVKKGNVEWFRDGSGIKARDFLCSCEGSKDEKRSKLRVPAYVRPTIRCNCKAKLRVGRLKGQNWRVTSFKMEHKHDMYPPDQAHLLRSARNVNSETEKCFETMVKCGISVARAYDFLQTSSHGRENVGYTQKDVHNSLSRAKKQSKVENGDAAQLVQYLVEMKNKEPYFYWRMERDKDDRLVNLFFRDYRCSIDYEYFGDVLSFDTTYRTNKYNLICCPFIGINHHFQSVMFGFAFLSDETVSSFVWLFETFLKSMGGKQPETIFTDQCQAMMNAIEKVFKNSHHRLCHWHINQNAPSHFGSLRGDSSFKKLWHKCMVDCYDEEEFEYTWKQMMEGYDIEEKRWFNLMYKLRHKWATAFSCHKFSAGLKATSRSEGTNAALKKKFGGSTSSLFDCVIAFEKVQDTWRMDEKEKDTRSHHGKLHLGNNSWVIHAAEVYTMEILILFQKEVNESIEFAIIDQEEVVGTSMMRFVMKSRRGRSTIITVQFDKQNSSINCSCHKFETFGILCSHILKVLDRVNIDCIPERYIKMRWTKDVRNRVCEIRNIGFDVGDNTSHMVFVHELMRLTYDFATRSESKEAKGILTKSFEGIKSQLDDLCKNVDGDKLATSEDLNVNEDTLQETSILVRDPERAKTKGTTDAYTRHWDVKDKKKKVRKESSKKTTKSAKKRCQSLQAVGDEWTSQTSQGATNALQSIFQSAAASQLPLDRPSYPMSFVHRQPNFQPPQNPYPYPFQTEFSISQPGASHVESQLSYFSGYSFQATPGTSQLPTELSQWSYTMPLATKNLDDVHKE